jgi:hypothetical protein
MKRTFFLSLVFMSVIFISCKKDNSTGSSSGSGPAGNWQFVSLTAHTSVTQQYNDAGSNDMDISTSDYTSSNASGSVSFSNGTATGSGVAYSVSTTVYETSYEDGTLVDTFSAPFTFTVQPTNSVSTYKTIGTDSLYFPGGGFISSSSLSGGGAQQTEASGYKYSIAGDSLLTMTSVYSKDTVENLGGITAQVHEAANYSVLLRKK